jgi:hypothetical protein
MSCARFERERLNDFTETFDSLLNQMNRRVGKIEPECILALAIQMKVRARKKGDFSFQGRNQTVDLAALVQEMFFVISEENYPGAAHVVAETCQEAGFRPKIIQAAERGHTLLGLVAGNCGVALVPEPLRALPHSGVVFRALKTPPRCDLYLAWNPKQSSAVRDAFLGLMERP